MFTFLCLPFSGFLLFGLAKGSSHPEIFAAIEQ
jgi:hypothetical protein